jgi:quercetin dioxygenase-like cupin family protein
MRTRRWITAAVVVPACLVALAIVPSTAQTPITAVPLTGRSVFTDDVGIKIKVSHGGKTKVVQTDDPSRTVVVQYTIEPGAVFPWHSHAGPVVVNVVQGSLVYVPADGCMEHTYPAGTAFVDLGRGHVHSAYNPSSTTNTILVATFFEAPATDPLLIPADPGPCELP